MEVYILLNYLIFDMVLFCEYIDHSAHLRARIKSQHSLYSPVATTAIEGLFLHVNNLPWYALSNNSYLTE